MNTDLPFLQPLTAERSRVLASDPARELLGEQMKNATTIKEIGAALEAQLAWLRANPDDFGVLQTGEMLIHTFEWICLSLLEAMGYEFLPPTSEAGEDSLLRRKGGAPGQRLAVDCIWTYVPASANALQRIVTMMRDLHATEGWLIAGAGLNDEALQLAQRLGIRVIDGDELKRLLATHAPELNVPAERTQHGVGSHAWPQAETGTSAQSR